MRLVFVITGLGLGGAEKQVCILADKLSTLGHEVMVISLTKDVYFRPDNRDVKIKTLNMEKNISSFLKTIIILRKIILDFEPDIVHAHMFHANIMVRCLSAITKTRAKIICTAHNKNEGGMVRKLLYRYTDHFNDVTTNVSQEALDQFIKDKAFKERKSVAVYNGIDTDFFVFSDECRNNLRRMLGISNEDVLLLAIGRLTEAKDYPNLIKAFDKLPENFKLVIVGEGDCRNSITDLIDSRNLSTRVIMVGAKNNVKDYYSACDIFVLSSAWEGFGLVVAEAMSCERIVVGTDSGGVREVIGDQRFIVPVKNSTVLANKIIELSRLGNNEKNDICVRNRLHIIEKFSLANTIKTWLQIYR
ncbi:glycosyltransferase [Citrobacter freundii]|uniref:glycosyltransferase n=1 Tax=Citrobacter freundii TaxID=546 RepID=UPI0013CF6EE2|nr:glycosyltransferase [Citrobacter freundii]EKX5679217.1 glycosyltransferase [Citrobacter freundii]